MGAALRKSVWQGGKSSHYHSLTTTNTSQNFTFMLSIWFQNLKSSSTWFYPCFPLRRAILLLYVESVYLLPSILEANTCVNCALILTYLLIALIILLCVDNYPCDMHVESWKQLLKLVSSFVLLQCLYFEFIALWVNSYARPFDACLESTIHEKFCYMLSIC